MSWASWLHKSMGRAPGTADKYLRHMQQLEAFASESGVEPWDLDLDHLERFTGLIAHEMGLTPQSRRPLVSAVRGFFRWAERQGYVKRSPATDLPYPRTGRRLPRPAQLATAERLLMEPDISTFTGLRDAALIATLAGTGMRVSGLVRMNRGHLVNTSEDGRERLMVVTREKGDHERYIPLPVEAAVLIRAYLAAPELNEMDLTLDDGDQVLWVTTQNRQVSPADYYGERRRISTRTVHDMMQRYGKRAKLPLDQCHPHAFRHLYATELAEADVDLLQRQTLLGHKDPKSTEIYTHVAMRRLTRAVDQGNPLSRIRTGIVRDAREMARRIDARLGSDGS